MILEGARILRNTILIQCVIQIIKKYLFFKSSLSFFMNEKWKNKQTHYRSYNITYDIVFRSMYDGFIYPPEHKRI